MSKGCWHYCKQIHLIHILQGQNKYLSEEKMSLSLKQFSNLKNLCLHKRSIPELLLPHCGFMKRCDFNHWNFFFNYWWIEKDFNKPLYLDLLKSQYVIYLDNVLQFILSLLIKLSSKYVTVKNIQWYKWNQGQERRGAGALKIIFHIHKFLERNNFYNFPNLQLRQILKHCKSQFAFLHISWRYYDIDSIAFAR